MSNVFGKPTVDLKGDYNNQNSNLKEILCNWRSITSILSIVLSTTGLILYLISPLKEIHLANVIILYVVILINSVTNIMKIPIYLSIISIIFASYTIPEILPQALYKSTKLPFIGSILLIISSLISFSAYVRKVDVKSNLRTILLFCSYPILFATAITLPLFSKTESCYSPDWKGITPFSCTLWHSGQDGERYLTLSSSIAFTAPLLLLSTIMNSTIWLHVSLFLLSSEIVNQIEPILQRSKAFDLNTNISLILSITAFVYLVDAFIFVINNGRNKESEVEKYCKRYLNHEYDLLVEDNIESDDL